MLAHLRGLPLGGQMMWAFLLGALSILAFAPYHILPALVLSFTLLIWLHDGCRTVKAAALLGFSFGFGQFLIGLFWIAEAFSVREGFSYAQGVISVFALSAGLSLFPTLILAVYHKLSMKGAARVLMFAALWSLGEWIRGHVFTGFPWNINAASVSAFPILTQSAAYLGAYGLSFLMTLVAVLPASLISPSGEWRMRPLIAVLILPLILMSGGAMRLQNHPTQMHEDLTLVLVQAGIGQKEKWQRDKLHEHFRTYMDMSATALEAVKTPNVAIIWPETAIAYPVDEQPGTRFLISKILDRNGVIITGAPRFERLGADEYAAWNSIFAIDNAGNITGAYDKAHLVPFGEYVPLRPLLARIGIERIVESLADFRAGPGPMTLTLNGLPAFSPLVCYEAIFPGRVTAHEGPRPQWLANLSNDAWFGDSSGPAQHYALARLRAVEEGLPLIRATPTGISVATDPLGREIARLEQGKKGVLLTSIPLPLDTSPLFSEWGHLLYFLLISVIFVICFVRKLW